MQPFNEYISGSSDAVARQELDRLVGRYEWFTTARRARVLLTATADHALQLPLMFSPTIPPKLASKRDLHRREATKEDDIIGRFLEHGTYRIVPDQDAQVEDAVMIDTFDNDGEGEILTEELAEIFRSQGLGVEAKEIYRKLSLLNPEKSIYFADIIARIEVENNK